MPGLTLLDTGPVVGLLVERDPHHEAVVAALKESHIAGRTLCITREVVGEAYTFIRMRVAPRRSANPALAVLDWVEQAPLVILEAAEPAHARAVEILRRYGEHDLSYVDALLLALAERYQVEEIMTVDRAHFGAVPIIGDPVVTVV